MHIFQCKQRLNIPVQVNTFKGQMKLIIDPLMLVIHKPGSVVISIEFYAVLHCYDYFFLLFFMSIHAHFSLLIKLIQVQLERV